MSIFRHVYRDLRPAARIAVAAGWTIEHTGRHTRWTSPTGRRVSVPCTPGRGRSHANTLANLKRAGLAL